MTSKSDFTDEEWTRLKRCPFVVAAVPRWDDPKGLADALKETAAEVRRSAETGGHGELVAALAREIAAEGGHGRDPLASFTRARTVTASDFSVEYREVIRFLSERATPADAAVVREWLLFAGAAGSRAARRRKLRTTPLEVGVDFTYGFDAADTEAVATAFRRAGFHPRIETFSYRGAGAVQWVITVTVATPIIAFFQSFGSELGKDAYEHVKAWFREIRDGGSGKGSVVVRDDPRSTYLILDSDIPEEAFDALSEMQHISGDPCVVWDKGRRAWVKAAERDIVMRRVDSHVVGGGVPHVSPPPNG